MVVLLPDAEQGEFTQVCRCGAMGICSGVRARSTFQLRSRRRGLWETACKSCANERSRAVKARRRLEEEEELRRIDWLLAAERAGVPLPTLEDVQNNRIQSEIMMPGAPFRAWLRRQIMLAALERGSRRQALGVVAARLGVQKRRIYAWLNEMDEVDEASVDRALSREGSTTVAELYEHWTEEDEQQEELAHLGVTECASPGCENTASADSLFCTEHGSTLARIRADYEADAARFKARIRRAGARPTCCNPTCHHPRDPGGRYCPLCLDDGWNEGDIE